MSGRDINFIYEFTTPLGYLPMGYNHQDIPLIFDDINNRDVGLFFHPLIYYGTPSKNDFYQCLAESHCVYEIFSSEKFTRKQVDELDNEDLENKLNLFVITPTHNQTIIHKLEDSLLIDSFTQKSLEYLRTNKNFKVVIFDNKEGGYTYPDTFFNNFLEFYNQTQIQPNQLIFITNTANINDIYQNYKTIKNIDFDFMECHCLHSFIYGAAGNCIVDYYEKADPENKSEVEYDNVMYSIPWMGELNETRSKYFLCMNRNSERLHRTYLVSELIEEGLFDKGYISLLQSDTVDEMCSRDEKLKRNIGDRYPFTIDYDDKNFIAGMHNFFNSKESWLDSYFSVVNETTNDSNHIFITEKSVRPMIYYHPFIIHGNPHTLKELKKLGFETFPEFFDESYDDELDPIKRMNMIVSNVKNICELSREEVHNIYQSVKPKLLHNRKRLVDMSMNKKEINTFINAVSG